MTAAQYKIEALIVFYMREYDYTRQEAIASIKADLKELTEPSQETIAAMTKAAYG